MIKIFAVNPFREVTYVVSDEATKECVIIDCGAQEQFEFERIADYIQNASLKPVMAINTHAHIDHILGVKYITEKYNIPFALSSLDLPTLELASHSAAMYGLTDEKFVAPKINIDLKDRTVIKFGQTVLKIIPTPGHTSGGVSFFNEKSGELFTGDTLFQGSIGRTDLPTGDYDQLMKSIIFNLLPLGKDREVTVFPGHGNHTTLATEVTSNPFISEVLNDEVNPKNI